MTNEVTHSHRLSKNLCGRKAVVVATLAFALLGCKREERAFRVDVPYSGTNGGTRLSSLQPGVPQPYLPVKNDYEHNAWAMAEGKLLFTQFNCNGCHANGGGGMGPALMDNRWIYGSNPEQIYATIMEGRPNGMPSFRGKINDNQAWQIAAYVRSMSGLVPFTAAPNRNDNMQSAPPESSREKALTPNQSFVPPSAEMPL